MKSLLFNNNVGELLPSNTLGFCQAGSWITLLSGHLCPGKPWWSDKKIGGKMCGISRGTKNPFWRFPKVSQPWGYLGFVWDFGILMGLNGNLADLGVYINGSYVVIIWLRCG